ncbi:MAG: ABC transporter ATP-binding protein [Desulfosalsimonas sp.]
MNAGAKPITDSRTVLEVKNVDKSFGGIRALRDISFILQHGSITGLIGPNGAGKTTLFNLITGIFPADRGEIRFNGRPVNGFRIHELVELGIARTFQNVELFGSMSALENIMVGMHTRTRCGMIGSILRLPRIINEERRTADKALELLEFVGLEKYAHQKSGDLPFGWQRMLELARALAAEPELLLLDEPAAGLNMSETRELEVLISHIRDQGMGILLVEHDMNLTMSVCDKIVVLDQGRKIAEGPPRAVQSDEAVMAAYLGKARNQEANASNTQS